MNRSTVIKVGNFVWFQTIWWLVILFQNDAVMPVMLLILAWISVSPKRLEDAKLMGTLFLLGTIVDAALTNVGLFIFNETEVLLLVGPYLSGSVCCGQLLRVLFITA